MVVLDLLVVALDLPFSSVLQFQALFVFDVVALGLLVAALDLPCGGS